MTPKHLPSPSPRFFYGDPGRYSRDLRHRLRPDTTGIADPDFALGRDAESIEKIRRDPVIAKALNQRLHYIGACDWHLEAPTAESRAVVPYFDALLRRIESFAQARLLLSRAVFEGTRWAKMAGQTATLDLLGNGRPLRWFFIDHLIDIDKRRLRLDSEPALPLAHDPPQAAKKADPRADSRHRATDSKSFVERRYFWNLYDPHADQWRRVAHPEHFVRHTVHADEGSLGYGRGLLESLYFYWRAKTALFSYMCEGAERFAYPWIIARIAPGGSTNFDATLGSAFPTADERADALIAALEKMRQASVLVLDQHDDVQTVDLSGQGNALILDLVKYVDRCMVELILGASLPTGSGENGSLARARIEKESTGDLLQFDRESLEDTLTRDLIGALWRYNQPAFAALGLAHLQPPAIRLGSRPQRDPEMSAKLIAQCAAVGVPLMADEVYAALGFSTPPGTPPILFADTFTPDAPESAHKADSKATTAMPATVPVRDSGATVAAVSSMIGGAA